MQALVNAIRGTGATQPIMLPGLDYANDLSQWLAHRPQDGAAGTADDQLVASFHNYNIQTCNNVACWDQVIAPIAAQVPVVAGEFGTDDCKEDHLNSFMDWADARGIGSRAGSGNANSVGGFSAFADFVAASPDGERVIFKQSRVPR